MEPEATKVKIDGLSVIYSTIGFGLVLFGFSSAGSRGWGDWLVVTSIIFFQCLTKQARHDRTPIRPDREIFFVPFILSYVTPKHKPFSIPAAGFYLRLSYTPKFPFAVIDSRSGGTLILRQYRTILSAVLRSQIFRQIVQSDRRQAGACQGSFVLYDGKDASKSVLKALAVNCAVLP